MKKLFALWLALLLSLSLTACGGSGSTDPDDVAGDDWRVTGVVRDTGTITRNGGDVDVLVCINADSADFYYDDATPVMYDYAAYPIALQCDPWEAFRSIDFADRNGDGNSDVALLFELDGAQALMVWYWDKDSEQLVFQPEESQIDGYTDDEPVPEGWTARGTWMATRTPRRSSASAWPTTGSCTTTRTARCGRSTAVRFVWWTRRRATTPPIPRCSPMSATAWRWPATTPFTGAWRGTITSLSA